ncbi:MAG TPA: hypothetical protein DD435_02840 [Cyanobacteria bacterium UBA8530]|nr:hypothetical protein [Cyanobacteria bacterium UBA8530]
MDKRKRLWQFGSFLLLALILMGCKLAPSSNLLTKAAVREIPEGLQALLNRDQKTQEKGSLSLKIRWPQKVRGFRTAGIPYSTDKIVLTIKQRDVVIKTEEISAPPVEGGAPTYSVFSYELDGGAYAITIDGRRGETVIAQGNAAINVVVGKSCPVSITLNVLNAPAIESFSELADQNVEYGSIGGLNGDTFKIRGRNFINQAEPNEKPEVRFNETIVPDEDLVVESDSSLTVVVPAGATTGRVVVRVDGIDSTSNLVFWMVRELSIKVDAEIGDTHFLASPVFLFRNGETAKNYASADPLNLKWTIPSSSISNGNCVIGKNADEPFAAKLTVAGFDFTKHIPLVPRNPADDIWHKTSFINAVLPGDLAPDPNFSQRTGLKTGLSVALDCPAGAGIVWFSELTTGTHASRRDKPVVTPVAGEQGLFTVTGNEKGVFSLIAVPKLGTADVQASLGGSRSNELLDCPVTYLNTNYLGGTTDQRLALTSSINYLDLIVTRSANLGLTIGE